MDISDVSKFKWNISQTQDAKNIGQTGRPVDSGDGKVALEPQRIRLFIATFSQSKGEPINGVKDSLE